MMIQKVVATLALSAVSALLYRIGGMSKEEAKQKLPWLPKGFVDTKARDVGCSVVSAVWMYTYYPQVEWYWVLLAFAATWGSLTTYWDNVPFNKGEDNFFMHGFFIGLAHMFYAAGSGLWVMAVIRMVVLAGLMGWVSKATADVDKEECGRGALIVATMGLYLIR